MEWSHDGTPIQPGTCTRDFALTGHRPHYSIYGLREMVVVARYYIDDDRNRSKRYVEYTCRDVQTSELYQGCRQLSQMSGIDDGDDNTLKPTGKLVPGATATTTGSVANEQSPANSVDGDQVLVAFIEGSRSRPVIVGVFRHSSSQYGATASDGERRLTTHKGTSIEIKQDATYVITHKSGSLIRMNSDGSIDFVPAGGGKVHEGDPAAFDAAVRGTTYRSAEDTMLSALSTCLVAINTYAVAIQAIADPTNVATPVLTTALGVCEAAIATFQAAATTYLSTKVTIST